jgi:tRNA threonylcarbamoyladenosine biosynthesis protein TsaB
MKTTLAIDTHNAEGSVALQKSGSWLEEATMPDKLRHSEWLLPSIGDMLACRDIAIARLDEIYLTIGPGSFTGLRVSAGVAQGLAVAHSIPVFTVSSLAFLSWCAMKQHDLGEGTVVHIALDARMGDVYHGVYQVKKNGLVNVAKDELVSKPSLVEGARPEVVRVGDGWPEVSVLEVEPRARYLADMSDLAERKQPWEVQPVYLRENILWEKWQKKSG